METESNKEFKYTQIIRLPEVKDRTGLSKTTIYRMVKERQFPSSVNLGGRAVGWVEAEVEAYLNQRIEASRQVEVKGGLA